MNKTIRIAAACTLIGGVAFADGIAPSDVTFEEYGEIVEPLTGMAGDADNGMVIMTTRGLGNCVACHQVTALAEHPYHGEVGPSLDGVGSRWNEAELRGIVANAKMTFPESMMPSFYKDTGYIRPGNAYTGKAAEGGLEPLLTAQDIEDVVAYLMTLQDE